MIVTGKQSIAAGEHDSPAAVGSPELVVVDIFCGCGGTSCGFREAGIEVAFALDTAADARETFGRNFPEVRCVCGDDITDFDSKPIRSALGEYPGARVLFSGCAPCQPFTKQQTTKRSEDDRARLLTYFGELIAEHRPDLVFVENVPGLQRVNGAFGPFPAFSKRLAELGYHSPGGRVVSAQDYGVPQQRERFIYIASLLGPIDFPAPTHGPGTGRAYATVREWIEDLPALTAGQEHADQGQYPNHRAAGLSEFNLRRIAAIKAPGGNRLSWPPELWLDCHKRRRSGDGLAHKGHSDVYGRLPWDAPATGLTTRCISLSNGRFGHPEQDRAISVREAARLQTFPDSFVFSGSMASMARQIGNAVPVRLARVFGEHFLRHVQEYSGG